MLFGRVSRKSRKENTPIQKQIPAYSFARHYRNFKLDWLLCANETIKKCNANIQDGSGAHLDKYIDAFLKLWAYFSFRNSSEFIYLVQIDGFMDSIKYQNWLSMVEILQWAMVGSSSSIMIRKKHQNKNKNGSMRTKPSFFHGQPSSLTWTENEWGELKRRSNNLDLEIWKVWSNSGWRNGLYVFTGCWYFDFCWVFNVQYE